MVCDGQAGSTGRSMIARGMYDSRSEWSQKRMVVEAIWSVSVRVRTTAGHGPGNGCGQEKAQKKRCDLASCAPGDCSRENKIARRPFVGGKIEGDVLYGPINHHKLNLGVNQRNRTTFECTHGTCARG